MCKSQTRKNTFNFYHTCCVLNSPTAKVVDRILSTFDATGKRNASSTKREASIQGRRLIRSEILRIKKESLKSILRNLRTQFARTEGKPVTMIFTDSALNSLVQIMPSTLDQLLNIKELGTAATSYGCAILSTIKEFEDSQPPSIRAPIQRIIHNQRVSQPEIIVLSSDDESEKPVKRKSTKRKIDHEEHDPYEVIIEKELSVDEIVRKRIKDAEEKGDVIVL
jgi:ribonuclease D